VGFACGYADQPHFTRDFKRRTAMTPAAYRSAFAVPPSIDAMSIRDQ
jgi:AraC-like DNA-binding protein